MFSFFNMPKKYRRIMLKAPKIMPTWIPESMLFNVLSRKAKTFESIYFTTENVILGTYNLMKHRSKFHQKPMPQKTCNKYRQLCQTLQYLKWGPKLIRNSILAIWDQILRRLSFDESLDAERHRRTPRLSAISGKAIRVWAAGFF